MIDENRQTGRSSRQLKEAYEKYGKFIYIIYGCHSVHYYKILLEKLNIPLDAVRFMTTHEVNDTMMIGINLPATIDHHAEYFTNHFVREHIKITNARFK